METKFYSLEEVSKNNGKNGNKLWIIIKDSIYDVTDYFEEHPGGGDLILEWAGRNATKAFDDAGHSSDAKKELKQYKIGEVTEEDRKKKQPKKVDHLVEEVKENRRSCCSYLTCGLCD
ncbi:cytochrome b5 [Asbolus verrucosus]|uniref:Cytochrome b5 n=1 Tax=Asbolus verrucosus TaxID=1661398 RepID=A0A482V8E5_ASBVE|nr:cytochrome b5 [Asbolus verrucosus]